MLLGTVLEHQINLLNTHCQVPIILQVFSSGIALLEFLSFKKKVQNIYDADYYLMFGARYFFIERTPRLMKINEKIGFLF